jgi:hypothetical protein
MQTEIINSELIYSATVPGSSQAGDIKRHLSTRLLYRKGEHIKINSQVLIPNPNTNNSRHFKSPSIEVWTEISLALCHVGTLLSSPLGNCHQNTREEFYIIDYKTISVEITPPFKTL